MVFVVESIIACIVFTLFVFLMSRVNCEILVA